MMQGGGSGSSGSSGGGMGGQAQQMMQSGKQDMKREMQQPERAGSDLALMGAVMSVFLAWYEYYYRNNKTGGIFVGLWPPTILAFANYLRSRAIEEQLKKRT